MADPSYVIGILRSMGRSGYSKRARSLVALEGLIRCIRLESSYRPTHEQQPGSACDVMTTFLLQWRDTLRMRVALPIPGLHRKSLTLWRHLGQWRHRGLYNVARALFDWFLTREVARYTASLLVAVNEKLE